MGRRIVSFEPAIKGLAELEKQVAHGAVQGGYTPRDVALALWPEHVVRACEAAYGYVEPGVATIVKLERPLAPFWLYFSSAAVPMATPQSNLMNFQWNGGIQADIEAVLEVCARFAKVRYTIRWLEKNAMPRVALYYAPWLAALAPALFEGVAPADNRTIQPISQIAGNLRAASTTVAMGILSPPIPEDLPPAVFKIASSELGAVFSPPTSSMFRII